MKHWTVYRYATDPEGKPLPETRTALCLPLPDKRAMAGLAEQGRRLAAEEGVAYLFKVEEVK